MGNIAGNTEEIISSVAQFADSVLERCRDRYGEKETPLLTDGINLGTGEPAKWEKHILSNLACQQNFLRTLDGLARLTGESKYGEQAREWIEYALSVLQDPQSGMLYWGGHTSYDLLEDAPLLGNHELKCVYPYYRFLYEVDPEKTSLLIQGFWNKHVRNWSNLLFNRHGEYADWDRDAAWEHEYSGGQLPIIDNSMLSFINTGSDLIYAGSILAKLSDKKAPLLWAKRLLSRYDEIRDEDTGLGGYQFNHREPCRVRISFKKPLGDRPDVNETTVITNGVIQTRYGRAALTWMNLYEELGDVDGQAFLDIVRKDLTAIGNHAYDFSDHTFCPVLADGMKLSPSDCIEGVGYCNPRKLEKVPANGLMFLVYAKAYRITEDSFFWKIARSLAQGLGWRDVFNATDENSPVFQSALPENHRIQLPGTGRSRLGQSHACALLGLLELHRATDQKEYLNLAMDLGKQMVQSCSSDGLFTTDAGYASIDNSLPLAILHLVAAGTGIRASVPVFYANATSFDPKVVISRRRRS